MKRGNHPGMFPLIHYKKGSYNAYARAAALGQCASVLVLNAGVIARNVS